MADELPPHIRISIPAEIGGKPFVAQRLVDLLMWRSAKISLVDLAIEEMLAEITGLQHRHADEERNRPFREWQEQARAAKVPPVDRTQSVLQDGSPVTPGHREIDPATGQQKAYVVLTAEERAKGFVRPVRHSYIHAGEGAVFSGPVLIMPGEKCCGTRTTASQSIAETFARDPSFYGGTFCAGCKQHRPLTEFVWEGTTDIVGT